MNKKILFGIAGLVILAELAWAIYTLNKPASQVENQVVTVSTTPTPAVLNRASFSIIGPNSVKIGQTVKVNFNLTASAPTAGADLIIKYDPKILSVVPVGTKASQVGKVYPEYPTNTHDEKLGIIEISGIAAAGGSGFSGEGVFATLSFKGLAVGNSPITLDWTPEGLTSDSNVSDKDSGEDVLKEVTTLNINVTK